MKATKRNCTCNIEVSNGTKSVTYQVCEFADKSEFLARVEKDFPEGGADITGIEDWAGDMFVAAYHSKEYGTLFDDYDGPCFGDTEERDFYLPIRLLPDDFFSINDVADESAVRIFIDGYYKTDYEHDYSTISREIENFNKNYQGIYYEDYVNDNGEVSKGIIYKLAEMCDFDLDGFFEKFDFLFDARTKEKFLNLMIRSLTEKTESIPGSDIEDIDLDCGNFIFVDGYIYLVLSF